MIISVFNDIFGTYFDTYKDTSRCRDESMLDIALRKHEFEKTLDEMWRIYSSGNVCQIVEYQKQVDYIKSFGFKVLRNSAGKHKIVRQ